MWPPIICFLHPPGSVPVSVRLRQAAIPLSMCNMGRLTYRRTGSLSLPCQRVLQYATVTYCNCFCHHTVLVVLVCALTNCDSLGRLTYRRTANRGELALPGFFFNQNLNPQAFGVVSFHLSPLPTKPLRLSSLSCRLDCQGVCRAPDKYPRSGNVLHSVGQMRSAGR